MIDKLHKMNPSDLQVLDTLLVTGAALAKSGHPDATGKRDVKRAQTWGYDDFVQYANDNLSEAAARGKALETAGGQAISAAWYGWYNDGALEQGKGEWSYPLTVYRDAAKLQDAKTNGPKTLFLEYQWETDSTQSNAFIMSSLMGDSNIMGLLGKFLSHGEIEKGDLRIQARDTLFNEADNMVSDVDKVFGNDPKTQQIWKDNIQPLSGQLRNGSLRLMVVVLLLLVSMVRHLGRCTRKQETSLMLTGRPVAAKD